MSLKSWQKCFGILTTAFIFWVIAISTAYAGNCCDIVKDGLVACYPFDGDANDGSGNGNNGVAKGGLSYTSGKIGQAAKFDGISSYIKVPNHSSLNLQKDMTLSAWVYDYSHNPYGAIGTSLILFKGKWSYISDEQKRQYEFSSSYGYNVEFAHVGLFNNQTNGWEQLFSIDSIPINQWKHITVTYDGQSQKVYIDGKLNNSKNSAFNLFIPTSPEPLTIGAGFRDDNVEPSNVKDGLIDDLRIYNRALSEAEIQQIYNCSNRFTITASAGTGGTISPSGSVSVNNGESKTFSISSAACYDVDTVLVNGSAVTLTNGQYTFANVTANQTISATFKQNPCCTYSVQTQIDAARQEGIQSCKDNPAGCGLFSQAQSDQKIADAVKTEQLKWDANGDGRIGLEDIIRMLQVIAGLRP